VFEFCNETLEDVLKKYDGTKDYIPLQDIKRYTKEILNGLAQMHELKIVHRDLKPENILLKNGQVKICDFGSSKFLDTVDHMNTPYVVSRYYRSPELILASNKYDASIDIWGNLFLFNFLLAVGCILFELMSKTPFFPGDTEGLQLLEQISIIGSPTDREIGELGKICDHQVIKILKRC
jgi:serine/threonine protein kinase